MQKTAPDRVTYSKSKIQIWFLKTTVTRNKSLVVCLKYRQRDLNTQNIGLKLHRRYKSTEASCFLEGFLQQQQTQIHQEDVVGASQTCLGSIPLLPTKHKACAEVTPDLRHDLSSSAIELVKQRISDPKIMVRIW